MSLFDFHNPISVFHLCMVFALEKLRIPGPLRLLPFVSPTQPPFLEVAVVCKLNAQVIFLSETSATRNTQMLEGPKIQKAGFTAFWGDPVAIQKETRTGVGFRGRAVGVALATSMPARVPRSPNSDFLRTNRFLRLGFKLEACVFCVSPYTVSTIHMRAFRLNKLRSAINCCLMRHWPARLKRPAV